MFKNMRLSTKLMGGFGVILVLLIAVAGLYHYAVSSSSTGFNNLMETQIAVANHADKAEVLMLQCRRAEKDFLLRKDKKYLSALEDSVTKLKTEAEAIVTLANSAGDEQAAQDASQIIGDADEYAQNFKRLVTAYETRGLDHKSGLQGQFRDVVHSLAEKVKEYEAADLYLSLLMARRYEKDYVRTKSDKYKDQLTTAMEVYQQLLRNSSCEKGARQAQERALKVYADAFSKYLAAGESQDLQSQCYDLMRSAAHEAETALNGIFVPDVGALVLDIRKNEKDYLLRGDAFGRGCQEHSQHDRGISQEFQERGGYRL